jgi:hypothetical protein
VSETKTQPAQLPAAAPAAPAQASPGPKPTTELKVSGHLMTLDAGLFCIFTPPGSPVPDQASGLPGIRLTLPPGPAFRPESITISTFREDGWLGGWNGAALVRVSRGPAQVLVTIYQAPNVKGEAPKLQILKLAEGTSPGAARAAGTPGAAPPPAPPPAPPSPVRETPAKQAAAAPAAASAPQNTPGGGAGRAAPAGTEITAHVQVSGDIAARLGEWVGTQGSKHWVEGFAIAPQEQIQPGDIEYQAVLGRGWLSPWAEGGQFCGSRGMSLPILGLRVRLRGEAAETHDCAVTATFVDGTKVGPLDNGEPAQAETLSPLEAFLVVVTPRATADKKAAKPAAKSPAGKTAAKPAAKAATPAATPAAAAKPAPARNAPPKPPEKVPPKPTPKLTFKPTSRKK